MLSSSSRCLPSHSTSSFAPYFPFLLKDVFLVLLVENRLLPFIAMNFHAFNFTKQPFKSLNISTANWKQNGKHSDENSIFRLFADSFNWTFPPTFYHWRISRPLNGILILWGTFNRIKMEAYEFRCWFLILLCLVDWGLKDFFPFLR